MKKDNKNKIDGPPKKEMKKVMTPLGEIEVDRKDNNNNILFRLQEGEEYKAIFANRCIEDRPSGLLDIAKRTAKKSRAM